METTVATIASRIGAAAVSVLIVFAMISVITI